MDNHIKLLSDQLPKESRPEFREYIKELLSIDRWYGIDTTCLGFMEDYAALANLISHHICEGYLGITQEKNFVIYDIGCSTALQHVFFGKYTGYIGVSPPGPPVPKFFLPNCRFYSGYLSEVVDTMEIDYDNSFGIANMSILYDRNEASELEIFNRVFKRKFVI